LASTKNQNKKEIRGHTSLGSPAAQRFLDYLIDAQVVQRLKDARVHHYRDIKPISKTIQKLSKILAKLSPSTAEDRDRYVPPKAALRLLDVLSVHGALIEEDIEELCHKDYNRTTKYLGLLIESGILEREIINDVTYYRINLAHPKAKSLDHLLTILRNHAL
jgi:hypothetical protein